MLGDRRVIGDLRGVHVGLGDQLSLLELLLPAEVSPPVHHGHLGLGGLRVGHRQGGPRVLEVRAGLGQHGPLVEHRGLRRLDLGRGLVDLGLKDLGVDPRDDLSLVTCELKSA